MRTVQKKICLLGAFAVGKTSLVRRYVEGIYNDQYLSTIGVKISHRTLTRPAGNIELFIWDLAGSHEFIRSENSYLLGSAGALIVCDLTRRDTLLVLERYIGQVHAVNANARLVIVGNKADLADARKINQAELNAICQSVGAPPAVLTSAKTGENVEQAFTLLAEQLEV